MITFYLQVPILFFFIISIVVPTYKAILDSISFQSNIFLPYLTIQTFITI